MPPPKDPEKYAEWLRKQRESHKGQNLGGGMPPRSEEWYRKQRESHLNKHPSGETRIKMSASKIGNTNSLGHKASDTTKQKMSISHKNVPKSEDHKKKIAMSQNGHTVSRTTRDKIAVTMIGKMSKENHPNWKGGITSLKKIIRECTEMYEWKQKVFERDEYRDWYSGLQGIYVEAHHVIPFAILMKKYHIASLEDARNCKELWDVKNGITMSKSNHKAHHDMWGTANCL